MSSAPKVWCNGKMVSADCLPLGAMDLGLTVGLGVFETVVMHRGETPLLGEHLVRLEQSTGVLGLMSPDEQELRDAIRVVVAENGLSDGRARVRVTVLAKSQVLGEADQASHLIVSAVAQTAPAAFARLAEVSMRVNERGATSGIKCTSYAEYVMAYRAALAQGADEAVLLNTQGNLCECAMANLFLVREGELYTPALSSGCLPGVTRAAVMRIAADLGVACHECVLDMDDLRAADEILITSSAREVQPACLLGSEVVVAGGITQKLRERYRVLFSPSDS